MAGAYGSRIRFRCPRCMAELTARPRHAGQRRTCPRCQLTLKVPSAEEAERLAALRQAAGEYAFWDTADGQPQDRQYFSLRCRLCATRMDATPDQVGEEITCPDCGTAAIVPPPPAAAEKPAAPARRVDDEYAICEGLDQPDASHAIVYQQYLRVICKRCGTRMLAALDQVGEEIVCPDCQLAAVVPAPVEKAAESPPRPDSAADQARRPEEYSLAAGVDQPPPGTAYVKLQCPHCHTRLPATVNQVGTQIVCPDCGTTVLVPEPQSPPPSLPGESARTEEFGVGAAIVAPEYHHVEDYRYVEGYVGTRGQPEEALDGGRGRPARRPPADSVEEKPAPAEAAKPQPPRGVFVVGILSLPLQDGVWQRWLALSAAAMMIVLFLATGIHLIQLARDPVLWVGGLGLIVTSGTLGIIWSAPAAAIWLTIVQDSAEGAERIEEWPEAIFVDWMLGVLFVFNSLGLATFAGVMLRGALREYAGIEFWPAAPLFILAAFPLLLSSMLETGSALNPVSWPVWRSVLAAWPAWLVFYVASGVAAAAGAALAAGAASLAGLWGVAVVTPLLVALALVYARLLGRLGWVCQSLAANHADSHRDEERR